MPVKQPNGPAVFPFAERLYRKWGVEEILVKCGHYTFKRIIMNAGAKGGLQYHHRKDESGYIISGSALVEYDPGDGSIVCRSVVAGDCVRFPQGAVHRVTAGKSGVQYIEASTPHLNDRCHCEAAYGFKTETGGLPSTTPEDVVTIPIEAGLHDT